MAADSTPRLAGPHTTETALRKSWTAVSFRTDTLEMTGLTQAGREQSGVRRHRGDRGQDRVLAIKGDSIPFPTKSREMVYCPHYKNSILSLFIINPRLCCLDNGRWRDHLCAATLFSRVREARPRPSAVPNPEITPNKFVRPGRARGRTRKDLARAATPWPSATIPYD